jgi:hypothetical protein
MMHDCVYHREIEKMRRHREELQLAIAEGLTLDQARERLASYRNHEPRLGARPLPPKAEPERVEPPIEDEDDRPLPWWRRD